jgi:hypothetical protein
VQPTKVRDIPLSRRIRARTGKAVMLMEMPMNKANGVNVVPAPASSLNKKYASKTPRT